MKKRKNNEGSTMVEVLVGFVILVIVISACLENMIKFSANLVMESQDIQKLSESFKESIYKRDSFTKVDGADNIKITLTYSEESKDNLLENEKNLKLDVNKVTLAKHIEGDYGVYRFIDN